MAVILFGAKPLPQPVQARNLLNRWKYVNTFQWVSLKGPTNIFTRGNAFENLVCDLSSTKHVNPNSLGPGDKYNRQLSGTYAIIVSGDVDWLIAWYLYGAKPLPEPMIAFFVNGALRSKFQWNLIKMSVVQRNVYGSAVCKMRTSLSRGRSVDVKQPIIQWQ